MFSVFQWFTILPPHVQAMWFGVLLLFILWTIPFFTCRFYFLGGDSCWEATNTKTVLLFMVVIPMTVYVTNQELFQKRGYGFRFFQAPTTSSFNTAASTSSNMTNLPSSMFRSALKQRPKI